MKVKLFSILGNLIRSSFSFIHSGIYQRASHFEVLFYDFLRRAFFPMLSFFQGRQLIVLFIYSFSRKLTRFLYGREAIFPFWKFESFIFHIYS